jgi:hypothetical protein
MDQQNDDFTALVASGLLRQDPSLTHGDMYLSGQFLRIRGIYGPRLESFSDALEECLNNPLSGGITRCDEGTYIVCTGSTLIESSSGEVSWLKVEMIRALEKAREEKRVHLEPSVSSSQEPSVSSSQEPSVSSSQETPPEDVLVDDDDDDDDDNDNDDNDNDNDDDDNDNDKPTEVLLREMILEKISMNDKEIHLHESTIAEEKAIIDEKEKSIYRINAEVSRYRGEVEYLKKQLVILGNVTQVGKGLSQYSVSTIIPS